MVRTMWSKLPLPNLDVVCKLCKNTKKLEVPILIIHSFFLVIYISGFLSGQLYIKIQAFESNDIIQKKKSDRFDPTISLKLETNTATLRANVNSFMLNHVQILVRLLSKNVLGKKTLLGKIEIDKDEPFWKEIVAKPGEPVTKMVNFD